MCRSRRGRSGFPRVPGHECCTFRGSVVALEAATGQQVWKTYTIDEAARPTKKNKEDTIGALRGLRLEFADDRCKTRSAVRRNGK